MDDEKHSLCKPGNSERRLRLRKDYKESTDDKACSSVDFNNESGKNDAASTSKSTCDDDSIMDFKSPRKNHFIQPKIVNSNRFPDKSKKKALRSKSKVINNEKRSGNSKSLQNRKILHNVQQPSIESSFFKSEKKETDSPQTSTDVKTAYVCPLCFKNFKDENSQAVHAKSCAAKNNVTTKKLMDAMELQERQAAERKSLGLLSAPVLQDKKKFARKMAHSDPDLQLALALSKSLYEREMEEWDEAQIIAISSSSPLPDNNVENAYKTTLQNFGFTSNRNILPANNWPINKTKRKRPLEPTALQRRTAVERERILTERIAEILMGYKDFTQKSQEVEEQLNIKEKIVIKSQLLQQLHQAENTLWNRTRLTSTQNVFYVKQLSSQITPLEKKEQKLKEEQDDVKLEDQNVNNEKSFDNKQMQEIQEVQAVKAANDNNEELIISSNGDKACCKERKFLDTLVTSWRNVLNDSSASDIIIFVRNSRHIWAHKLVFYVRCTNILLDVTSNDTEYSTAKEKISWIDVDYDVALVFLEFIYCGLINRHSEILNSETLSGLRSLARKYKVNDLFVYLRELKFNSTIAQVKHSTCEENTENSHTNVKKTLNGSKLENSIFNASPNHIHNLENIQQYSQKILQKDVNDSSHSLQDSCTSAKDSCILQDEKTDLMKLSERISSRSNTPANCASPDIFDDTPVTKCNDKSAILSENYEDSNIHVLLSLIKQDADICSQRLTQRAEYFEPCKEISVRLKNEKQNVIEIDSDSEVNSVKSFVEDTHENPLIDTPQSSKSKSSQDRSLNLIKQKSDLTLFIEKIQRENAKSDSDLDSDIECPIEMSPIMHKNPFHINRHVDAKNSQSCDDNNEQIADREKKHGKLSIIEQRMQSYAEKNPDFYSRPSNECAETVKPINISYMDSTSPEKTMKSFHSNVSNYTQNYTPPADKDVNIAKQVMVMSLSSQIKTTDRSPSETVLNFETDEEDISMYSKYMRDHKDNSIAKYRIIVGINQSDRNLSNKNDSSDSIAKSSDINKSENNEILNQSILTQKDVDVIVSSDTEIESISSNVSCPIAPQKDDSDHEDNIFHSVQQIRNDTENSKQNIEDERSNKSLEFEIPEVITTNVVEEINVNDTTKSNGDEFNTSNAKMTSDDIDFSAILTQKSKLNDSNDDQNTEAIPSPIMVSSSPDFLNMESSPPDMEHYSKNISETNDRKSRNTANFSLNFEDDIYLANVNVDRYEKHHVLEKSQSASMLNITEFKKNSSRRYSNKNNRENIKRTNAMSDDVTPDCGNLDRMALTQNFTSIRTFKKKSLSEGQININRLRNQQSTSEHISVQLQCKYNQNIGSTKTAPKIIEKDVTPPPDYYGMKTPELHKEMKKYGLKAQKRSRAVKLLTHIYDELHPLVSIPEVTTEQEKITDILSDEDEGPPPKKRNVDNSLEKSNDSDDELLCSQDSNDSVNSVKDATRKEMQFYETESLPALENSSDITEAFAKLIEADKNLHNKILRYEPVNIEELHSTLRAHGFKCKLSNLMSFLDEQCITFYVPEQNARYKIRKKV